MHYLNIDILFVILWIVISGYFAYKQTLFVFYFITKQYLECLVCQSVCMLYTSPILLLKYILF